jgi:hypothetical protein
VGAKNSLAIIISALFFFASFYLLLTVMLILQSVEHLSIAIGVRSECLRLAKRLFRGLRIESARESAFFCAFSWSDCGFEIALAVIAWPEVAIFTQNIRNPDHR